MVLFNKNIVKTLDNTAGAFAAAPDKHFPSQRTPEAYHILFESAARTIISERTFSLLYADGRHRGGHLRNRTPHRTSSFLTSTNATLPEERFAG